VSIWSNQARLIVCCNFKVSFVSIAIARWCIVIRCWIFSLNLFFMAAWLHSLLVHLEGLQQGMKKVFDAFELTLKCLIMAWATTLTCVEMVSIKVLKNPHPSIHWASNVCHNSPMIFFTSLIYVFDVLVLGF
jgi:hypothetical protein